MRLRKIKLSGFKSFVDPTTLIIPGNLVGIVGPNGCGKSNIIDAVTWVMGESSAKHLRGESLTDVIFNGSTTRQPVGQASVELIFDNSEGKATGQYGSYNEISIKRRINREAISTYLLNGTRCRRKDIHSLFLGTGLGPRSYSIIEQGMISRFIEAKPDELRVFIEEAAGISKFRERRRETETRIRHTKENLNRLNDIREELGKQLNHLQRQAKAAERYQVLKQGHRQLNAELLSLTWRDLNLNIQARSEKVRAKETRVEQGIALMRKIEAAIEHSRDELTAANDNFNKVQSEYYQAGGDISQLEQKIQNTNERIDVLEADIAKTSKSLATAEEQQKHDSQQLQAISAKGKNLTPELQGSRTDSDKAYSSLNQAENALQPWQDEWDAYMQSTAGLGRQIEVESTRLGHQQAGLEEIRYRKQTLTTELETAEVEDLGTQLTKLDADVARHSREVDTSRTKLDKKLDDVRQCRGKVNHLAEKIADIRTVEQKSKGTLASLEALQQGDSSQDDGRVSKWLSSFSKKAHSQLVEQITVDPDWSHALETVLKQHLQSVVISDFHQALKALKATTDINVGIVTESSSQVTRKKGDMPCLLDKVSSDIRLDGLLADIYLAQDINEALKIYPLLKGSKSVVTRSGIWLGKDWMRVNQVQNVEDSILLREKKINTITSELNGLSNEITLLQRQLNETQQRLEKTEKEQHDGQKELSAIQEGLTAIRSNQSEIKERREQTLKRIEQIREELDSLVSREESDQQELDIIQNSQKRAEADLTQLSAHGVRLTELREKHQKLLGDARTSWQTTHEHSHEIALQLESISSKRASLEQAIKRNEVLIANLTITSDDLQANLQKINSPLADQQQLLKSKLAAIVKTEKRLSTAREQVQAVDVNTRNKEQERAAAELQVEGYRNDLEKVRIEAHEVKVKLQAIEEQLQAGNHKASEILKPLDKSATKEEWQEKINNAEKRIQRLGPINLAAIDEFSQLTERKNYLDSQNHDLSEAMNTLENAIRKIDKETRTRFKETFDNLNYNLKEMFPTLFGGGHAYLEMTGDDLLQTGVAVMARPPGKKNSNIHLLSGGEKALTAIALVFAIFKLNPAPFCILDEVDAPLDDTNAQRFSALVTEMSADVQFLLITHNKITMEITQQLLGVTMHEPGVSRLVSVDMQEAVKIAASA